MTAAPKPVWTDFLYLNRSSTGRRVAVMMFSTQREMREWQKRWRHRYRRRVKTIAIGRHTAAQASWFGRTVPGFRERVQGVVWLHLASSGAGVVAHEMTHVAHYATFYGRRTGPLLTPGPMPEWDEKVAWLTGWLVTQYWRKWWASHLSRDAE